MIFTLCAVVKSVESGFKYIYFNCCDISVVGILFCLGDISVLVTFQFCDISVLVTFQLWQHFILCDISIVVF